MRVRHLILSALIITLAVMLTPTAAAQQYEVLVEHFENGIDPNLAKPGNGVVEAVQGAGPDGSAALHIVDAGSGGLYKIYRKTGAGKWLETDIGLGPFCLGGYFKIVSVGGSNTPMGLAAILELSYQNGYRGFLIYMYYDTTLKVHVVHGDAANYLALVEKIFDTGATLDSGWHSILLCYALDDSNANGVADALTIDKVVVDGVDYPIGYSAPFTEIDPLDDGLFAEIIVGGLNYVKDDSGRTWFNLTTSGEIYADAFGVYTYLVELPPPPPVTTTVTTTVTEASTVTVTETLSTVKTVKVYDEAGQSGQSASRLWLLLPLGLAAAALLFLMRGRG